MINTVYRLVAPRRFEIAFEDIDLFGDNAIVRPTYGRLFAGVCGDFASAAGDAAPGHQYECGGVYGDRVRSGARHFSV